jgi:hypothetical protein
LAIALGIWRLVFIEAMPASSAVKLELIANWKRFGQMPTANAASTTEVVSRYRVWGIGIG